MPFVALGAKIFFQKRNGKNSLKIHIELSATIYPLLAYQALLKW